MGIYKKGFDSLNLDQNFLTNHFFAVQRVQLHSFVAPGDDPGMNDMVPLVGRHGPIGWSLP